MGRRIAGKVGRALSVEHYLAVAAELHRRNIRLKVNTVVTAESVTATPKPPINAAIATDWH
jgi:hypothetical protein